MKKQKNSGIIYSKGFTLIELLVVIAIIALLVSILLPSLNKAKDLAKRIVCASSLKGIGSTIILYATENDGDCPGPAHVMMALYDYPYYINGKADVGWYLIEAGLAPSRTDNLEFWSCPSHPKWDDFPKMGITAKMHYVAHCSGNDGQLRPGPFGCPDGYAPASPPMNLSEIKADTWAIQDADVFLWDATYPIDPVHSGGRNIMYMDTHVDWRQISDETDNPPSW